MKQERNDLKAGLFIVASVALIVAIVVAIKGVGRMLEPSQNPTVTFKLTDDVGGLRPGDDVRVGGFKVGVVREIEIVEALGETAHIRIGFSMPRRFNLKSDARVRVQSTLTGTSWLNFDDLGSPQAPLLASGQSLTGEPSSMGQILASLSEIAPDVAGVARDVRTVTVPKVNETIEHYRITGQHATALIKLVRSKVDPIIERYFAVADTAKDAAGQIRDVFGESKGDFKGTMSNLNASTLAVKEKIPALLEKADGALGKMQTTLDSTNAALEDVKQIASNTKDVSATARSVIVGNRGKIEAMIASLKTTGDNLKFASAEIRRSPWRLIYKPPPGELQNLNLYDSARQFAEGANDLNDAASALRDALNDPDVTQDQVRDLVERLDKSFANFNEIEQALWKQVR